MITDDNFHVAIDTCLKENNGEHAATGLCEESEYRSMPGWDTSRVTDMSSAFFLFDHISSFDGDITEWDTSQVTSMSKMFYEASAFNRSMYGILQML